MQMPFVMMLAISGLGCHNKSNVVLDGVSATCYEVDSSKLASEQLGRFSGASDSSSFASTPYPEIPTRIYNRNQQPCSPDWHAELRSTLCSFVIGRDPDVSTAGEIEASVYGVDSSP